MILFFSSFYSLFLFSVFLSFPFVLFIFFSLQDGVTFKHLTPIKERSGVRGSNPVTESGSFFSRDTCVRGQQLSRDVSGNKSQISVCLAPSRAKCMHNVKIVTCRSFLGESFTDMYLK